jgi:hypothetical protein|tara:strand:+ start:541 stop:1794 length:1254 start_codon:yes stop_codon:yes gene_type:complete
MPARDPYLGMHPRERQQARFKEWRASKAAERAKKIANAQETGGGQNPEQPASPTRNAPSNTVVYKYPLKRIDATGDYLRIQIFEQLRQDDIFGLKGKFFNSTQNDKGGFDYELKSPINLTDVAKIPAINDVWNDINPNGSVGRTSGTEQSAVEKVRKSGSIDIILPIPQQVSDNISVAYAESTINPLEAAGLNLAGEALSLGSNPNNTIKMPSQQDISNAIFDENGGIQGVTPGTRNALRSVFAGKALNTLGANVSADSILSRATGQILQSNLELLFSGVKLRTFPFIFDFTPRSQAEAEQVMNIIRALKQSAAPRRQGNGGPLFIGSPKMFQLQYISGNMEHPFLNKFKLCALSDISINYTASGTYATYSDGTPVHIRMQLTFKEMNPIYAEDYDEKYMGPFSPEHYNRTQGGVGF